MLSEKTYRSLKAMIYSGKLAPGERLVERRLSRDLGVSRVPLRESLLRLEGEGLITSVPRGPSYVQDFSKRDVVEMFSMRLLLEPFATRLAALNQKPTLVTELKRLCKRMTQCVKSRAWAKLDKAEYQFHYSIVQAAGHKKLLHAYDDCHILIGGMFSDYTQLKSGAPPNATALQHQDIINALDQRDPDVAEQAARSHIEHTVEWIQKRFDIWLAPKLPLAPPNSHRRVRSEH